MRLSRKRAIIFTFVSIVAGYAVAADKRPQVEDFLRMKSFPILMPLSLSPDGKHVAYTLQDGQRVGESTDPGSIDERPGSSRSTRGCEVWVTDIPTGRQTRISRLDGSSWGPSWSPDGQKLAYFSDSGGRARPWVWDRATGRSRPVADIRPKFILGYEVPLWTADGRSILFRASPNPTKSTLNAEPSPSVLVLDSPEQPRTVKEVSSNQSKAFPGMTEIFAGDLVEVQVDSGEIHVLTEGRQIYSYFPSPAGSRVAYTVANGYEEGDTDWTVFDIVVKDLRSGEEVTIVHDALLDNSGTALSWSPDGSRLAYGTLVHDKGTLYWTWSNGQPSPVKIGDAPKLSYPRYPAWNAKGDRLYVPAGDLVYVFALNSQPARTIRASGPSKIVALFASQRNRIVWSDDAEGDAIYLAEQKSDDLELEVHRARLSAGTDEKVTKLDAALALLATDVMDATRDGGVLVFPMDSPTAPQDLFVAGRGFDGLRQVTHVNPDLEQYKFPERRVIHWLDFDGHELRGTLLLPSGYVEGQRYPLIVDIYGGDPESRWGKQFSATASDGVENMQLYATRGYAILVADTVMGTETPMLDLYKSLIPGIEKVAAMGIADAGHVGVMGHSYGAYSVYSLLVQSQRFRAAVALSGSGNLLSNYGEMDTSGFPTGIAWAEKSQGRMGDTPWKVRDKYIENSPFFYLDRVNTPILIAHGDSDWHPAYEDREMFVGLRRLGKTAEYAEYRGGGHRISGWPYDDQLDLANRVLGWFDKYLQPATQTPKSNDESAQRSTTGN